MLDQAGVTLRTALLASLVAAAIAPPAAGSETPKHLLPAQYKDRVVAAKKGRVLLVNFWATWCEPCREEMPALAAAAKQFRPAELAVVLVSVDDPKAQGAVTKFLSAEKVPFVCWIVRSRDPQDFIDAVDRSWDGTVPYTMVYDRNGRESSKLLGKQTPESFAAAIRKAQGK